MTSIIIGNSHMAAVYDIADPRIKCIHTAAVFGKNLILSGSVEQKLSACTGPVISMIGGNSHNVLALIQPGPPFDVHVHGNYELPSPGATIVPHSAIFDAIALRANRWLKAFSFLAERFGPIVHVEPPPPICDDEFIRSGIAQKMAEKGQADFVVTPAVMRRKLWCIQNEVFREAGKPFNVIYLDAPKAAQDAHGFLLPEYWGDPTHANTAYGKLVIEELKERGHVPSIQ